MFHTSLLTPYKKMEIHGPSHAKPPANLIDGQEEFEVEAIINHKGMGTQRRYLVKWKGYPNSDRSWEPESNLENAEDILTAYKRQLRLTFISSTSSSPTTTWPMQSPQHDNSLKHMPLSPSTSLLLENTFSSPTNVSPTMRPSSSTSQSLHAAHSMTS